MQVTMLKNAFKPNDTSGAKTILKIGHNYDLSDADARALLDKGYAAPFTSTKDVEKTEEKAKTEPKEEKAEKKSDSKKK